MGKFTKDDLQVNDIVTTREGNMYMVYESNGKLFAIREQGYLAFDKYNNDLTSKQGAGFDIVKVQRPDEAYQLIKTEWLDTLVIWERKENEKVPLLSEAEYHILNSLSKEWEWVARDKYGFLCIYTNKPCKDEKRGEWIRRYPEDRENTLPFSNIFKFITAEDRKPRDIAELIEQYEENHNGN